MDAVEDPRKIEVTDVISPAQRIPEIKGSSQFFRIDPEPSWKSRGFGFKLVQFSQKTLPERFRLFLKA